MGKSRRELQKEYIDRLKQDPERYQKYLDQCKQYREKMKQDEEKYQKILESGRQYRKRLKDDPVKYKAFMEKQLLKIKQWRLNNPVKFRSSIMKWRKQSIEIWREYQKYYMRWYRALNRLGPDHPQTQSKLEDLNQWKTDNGWNTIQRKDQNESN